MEEKPEDYFYRIVGEEIKSKNYKTDMMTKAVAHSRGNKELAQSLYIKFRVQQLEKEFEQRQDGEDPTKGQSYESRFEKYILRYVPIKTQKIIKFELNQIKKTLKIFFKYLLAFLIVMALIWAIGVLTYIANLDVILSTCAGVGMLIGLMILLAYPCDAFYRLYQWFFKRPTKLKDVGTVDLPRK